jgi:hypothetical protein
VKAVDRALPRRTTIPTAAATRSWLTTLPSIPIPVAIACAATSCTGFAAFPRRTIVD